MHIAICDDNIADRKQLERLLKRESDKRAPVTGILYADSFGSASSMLANPRQYDVFYIDMCKTPGVSVSQIVDALTEKGVTAPIILCCSDINYREQSFPDNVRFLDKPIKVAELAESLDRVQELMGLAPSLIELRDEAGTIYLREEEILYACGKGRVMYVTLTNGRSAQIRTDADNLFSQWETHETFLMSNPKTIVNGRYIAQIGFRHIRMTDGKKFPILRICIPYAKTIYERYHKGDLC